MSDLPDPENMRPSGRAEMVAQPNRNLIEGAAAVRDGAFLSSILLLSAILYIPGLGFYSDDWAFLSALFHAGGDSLTALFQALYVDTSIRQRPLQALHLAWMYWLFGDDPLGYHVVNSTIFVVAILLFYFALRELRLPRLIVLALPLVYGLLPHYSTDRFWIAAAQANVSMALYFGSLFADLMALRSKGVRLWSWKFLSLAFLLGSTLAYEVVMPLFLLNAVVVIWAAQKYGTFDLSNPRKRTLIAVMVGSNLVLLLSAVSYKAAVTARAGGIETSYVSHFLHLAKEAAFIDYISSGILLPYVAWKVLIRYADAGMLIVGLMVGAAVFAYLYRAAGPGGKEIPALRVWLAVTALSPVVYLLGYAVFIATKTLSFHKTGIANRIAIAAAIGVAMAFTGGAGLASRLMPPGLLRRGLFPLAVALLCFCGFTVINASAKFWAAAYKEQQLVLADLRSNVESLPTGSTLILDGICPYIGPGIVFEGEWDLAGALQKSYDDRSLQADVVTTKMLLSEDGLTTFFYGRPRHYQYGSDLLLYDPKHKGLRPLVDAETTRRYFAARAFDPGRDCPSGSEGSGAAPF